MKREKFNLASAKILPKGGVLMSYVENVTIEGESSVIKHTVECATVPHPDLTDLFDELGGCLVSVLGLDFASALEAAANKKQAKAFNDAWPSVKSFVSLVQADKNKNISCHGISLSGTNENEGVILIGKNKNEAMVSSLNSSRVIFSRDIFGVEQKIADLCDLVEQECFEYLTEGKAAQLQLFDNSPTGGDVGTIEEKKDLKVA